MSRSKPGRAAVRALGFGVMSLVCFAVGGLLFTTGFAGRPSINDYFLAASAALFVLAVAQSGVAVRAGRTRRPGGDTRTPRSMKPSHEDDSL